MPMLAVQFTIADYAKWRAVFDRLQPQRDKAGLTRSTIYRCTDNPNDIIVWSETDDLAKAREAVTGPEIRTAMQDAGVLGPPKVYAIP